jgi:hypothetical protein
VESVGVSEVSKCLLDESLGLKFVEVAISVDVKLVPDLFDVGFDLLFRDFSLIESADSATLSMLFDANGVQTQSETFLLSSVENQLISQVVNDLERLLLQSFNIEFLDALVIVELTSWILLVADLAHYKNLWTVSLDVIVELGTSHMLELGPIAYITSELGAVELSVGLQFTEGLPDDHILSVLPALMRKLTEIYAVLKNFVDLLEEITPSLAIRTAKIVSRSWCLSIWTHLTSSLSITSSSISTGRHQFVVDLLSEIIPLHWITSVFKLSHVSATHTSFLKLNLTILAEKFVA